jgi:hypothetical protein
VTKSVHILSTAMKARTFLAIALSVVGFFHARSSAMASTITWTLSTNVPLSDGGTLNGTFTLNSAGFLNGNSWDLTTAGGTLPGVTYTTYINASDPNDFTVQFNGPGYTSTLNLVFEYSLLIPNLDNPILGGIGGSSYECAGFSCNSADIRYVDGGFASATPLPAALPLFAGGLGVMGLFARRRKRKNAAAAAA